MRFTRNLEVWKHSPLPFNITHLLTYNREIMSDRQAYRHLEVIFHHPGPITPNGLSGSQVRPYKILNAFKTLGVRVTNVTGSWTERRRAIKQIKQEVRAGKHYDFVYSENRTIPFAMTEEHRLPLHPWMDHLFLSFCNRNNIPVSMFYRDIHWRFPAYKSKLSLAARMVTIPLYWFDWHFHKHYLHTLYLPSLSMQSAIPSTEGLKHVRELPPGSAIHQGARPCSAQSERLRLLYVGGVRPPTYNIEPILRVLQQLPMCELTLCCREAEWAEFHSLYQPLLCDRVKVLHASGNDLAPLYQTSDLMILLRNPDPYLDFAVPVKLFESVGYELPVIASTNSEAGRIVSRDKLGWVTQLDDAKALLERLAGKPLELAAIKQHLRTAKLNHTWEARAEQVCREMTKSEQF